jgi:hypothetical protein
VSTHRCQPGQRPAGVGYPSGEIEAIWQEVGYYEKVRHEVKLASGDYLDTPAKRALYNNLDQNEALAVKIDTAMR